MSLVPPQYPSVTPVYPLQPVYDIAKILAHNCTIIRGLVYNPMGHIICAKSNLHEKPCMRVGKCPFHKGRSIVSPHNSINGLLDATGTPVLSPSLRTRTTQHPIPAAASSLVPPKKIQYKRGWSLEEHFFFLHGLHLFGYGAWKKIQMLVQSRDSTQIQSHAQKFQERQRNTLDRTKRSINDLTLDSPEMRQLSKLFNHSKLNSRLRLTTIHNTDASSVQNSAVTATTFQPLAHPHALLCDQPTPSQLTAHPHALNGGRISNLLNPTLYPTLTRRKCDYSPTFGGLDNDPGRAITSSMTVLHNSPAERTVADSSHWQNQNNLQYEICDSALQPHYAAKKQHQIHYSQEQQWISGGCQPEGQDGVVSKKRRLDLHDAVQRRVPSDMGQQFIVDAAGNTDGGSFEDQSTSSAERRRDHGVDERAPYHRLDLKGMNMPTQRFDRRFSQSGCSVTQDRNYF